ncbi:haloacid dehalogenase-like hydrolase domain-containing protein At4g39970 [Cucurbita moschata]|uniref:Haloacid dehalogenase-like hydrolase domain-containing protein At4g39970 n=1 Tax=Cucurbita moschata TaxID=3662 RepID=A0A6J1GEJ2_CUCMO|nr:haloacid dehalogenase-like hydrolase domain-containing protein At4g39970 [Cucurbita moschata]
MASITTMLLRPTFKPSSSDMVSLTLRRSLPPTAIHFRTSRKSTTHKLFSLSVSASLQALIFDCDGVILESEHCTAKPITMSIEFYDELQNRIGGGKPKMRWDMTIYFVLIRKFVMHFDWKTDRYKEIIKSGTVKPRPGVLRLMDEAKSAGRKLAVCSAATKSSVVLCLESFIGIDRFQNLDCFLAGDDVKEKKPDPSIYITASKKLGVVERDCLVVEDSVIGLQAATKAGMQCVVTYTTSTANQDFKEAIATYPDLSDIRLTDLNSLLQNVATTR